MKRFFAVVNRSRHRGDRKILGSIVLLFVCVLLLASSNPVAAQSKLFVSYPPNNHETSSSKIFLIGTAPKNGNVSVNGQVITRNAVGHFAPSFSLKPGPNPFTVRYGNQEIQLSVTRTSATTPPPTGTNFVADSLTPAVNIGRQPNEWLCFGAAAAPGATVSVRLGNSQAVPLTAQSEFVELPPNSAVLTEQNQPMPIPVTGFYRGCSRTVLVGDLGQPLFELNIGDQRRQQPAPGKIQILSPSQLEIAEVTAEPGTARTGPSTDYSRLTPLPKGTQASVTGFEGDWVRLDYGAWIRRSEVQLRKASIPPSSLIRSVKARRAGDRTDIIFPLQVPVPVTVRQGDRTFTLILHNTTAQTDTIRLDDDPLIERLDWYQSQPGEVEYVFNLKTNQQWGYALRYEGTSLILSLRHSPAVKPGNRGSLPAKPLTGVKVVLDPGHGGPEDLGARSPTGIAEKEVALTISKLVRQELVNRGATVVMTRDKDLDLGLKERMDAIANAQPTIALSLHYNALPDDGDAMNTKGLAAFWYHPQAHGLAIYLHNYLVKTLKRPSYGVFWNNLALTRPQIAPSVLLELGFLINPDEYEWIVNPKEQQRLAGAIANGVAQWLYSL